MARHLLLDECAVFRVLGGGIDFTLYSPDLDI